MFTDYISLSEAGIYFFFLKINISKCASVEEACLCYKTVFHHLYIMILMVM